MAESKYTLTYFDIRGMAECARFMFAYLDVKYNDKRIKKQDWAGLKEKQPFGKLPVLEVDGQQLSQSVTICRFLGKRYGLTVDDPIKEALLEAIIDNMRDVQVVLSEEFRVKGAEARQKSADAFNYVYSRLEPLAAEGYFLGSKPTWVDVYFTGQLDSTLYYKPNYLDPYPNLRRLRENILSKDSLKRYVESRPKDVE